MFNKHDFVCTWVLFSRYFNYSVVLIKCRPYHKSFIFRKNWVDLLLENLSFNKGYFAVNLKINNNTNQKQQQYTKLVCGLQQKQENH